MEAEKVFRAKDKAGFTQYEKRLLAVLEMDCVNEWILKTRYNDLKARWERVQEAGDEYTTTSLFDILGQYKLTGKTLALFSTITC